MKTLTILTVLFLYSALSFSQSDWINTFNSAGNNPDRSEYMTTDNAGNTYVTGYAAPGGYPHGVLLKISSTGSLLWSKDFYGFNNGNAVGKKILVDQNSNIYVFSEGQSYGNSWDLWIHKFDSGGNLVNYVRYGDPSYNESFGDAIFDLNGNIVVAVSGRTAADTLYQTSVIRYNTNCIPVFYTVCNPYGGHNYPAKLLKDLNGNIFVIGSILYHFQQDHQLVVILKLNSQFQQVASSSIDEPLNSITYFGAADMMLNTDLIICCSYPSANGYHKMRIQKLNNLLNIIWSRDYSLVSSQNEYYTDMKIDNSSNIYVTGYTSGNGDADVITAKFNIDGLYFWHKIYDRAGGYDTGNKLGIDSYGNVYTCGISSQSSQNLDAMIIKYNDAGIQQFVYNYNGQAFGTDQFTGINVSPAGTITASGCVTNLVNNNSNQDILTVRLTGNLTGTVSNSNGIPSDFSLGQNYPNPFNPSTKISFSIPKASFVKITVFDITGKEVKTLVSKQMNAGAYETDFNASKLTSGVYFYRITADGFNDTKKMMLVK